jgi:hypothetical protein
MRRSVASTAVALTLIVMSAPVHADLALLNNLDQPVSLSTTNKFYGQSFIAGTVNEQLSGASMQLASFDTPSSGITLEVESRNSDGTVGSTLFSNFSSSYNSTTHQVTFTANSPFELMAGTGYWLVVSDPEMHGVAWEVTTSSSYQSQNDYALPSSDTAMTSTQDNGRGHTVYYQLSDGPQLFELTEVAANPEPSTAIVAGFGAVAFIAYGWSRRRRTQQRQRAV